MHYLPTHGLRTPNEASFIENFWASADKFWGLWGIFGQTISTHFGTVSPLSLVFIIQPLFLQKKYKPLYPHPKLFEFEPQRNRDLAFPSVVRAPTLQLHFAIFYGNHYKVTTGSKYQKPFS